VSYDIVSRLRDAAWVSAGASDETKDDRLFREAADEIERLRKVVNKYQTRDHKFKIPQ
jgi:hypothetical protein